MTLRLTCCWCEDSEEFDNPRVATDEGWFIMWIGSDPYVYCCTECWLSSR